MVELLLWQDIVLVLDDVFYVSKELVIEPVELRRELVRNNQLLLQVLLIILLRCLIIVRLPAVVLSPLG